MVMDDSFSSVVNGHSKHRNTCSSSCKPDFGMMKMKRGDGGEEQYGEDDDEDGGGGRGRSKDVVAASGVMGWQNASSRIIRVSRATGGKDRHSKVWTSRGLRDRRIRLSVTTAIQFYDLQDRLGYDQPSKAVEWLINAAADPIAELPSLNNCFPAPTDNATIHNANANAKKRQSAHLFDSVGDVGFDPLPLSKSACSSTSENSKGSGLSLARPDVVRVGREKARERARERAAAKESPISQKASSFSELLAAAATSPAPEQPRIWPAATAMDYLSNASAAFSGPFPTGNLLHQPLPAPFNVTGSGSNTNTSHDQRLQHQHAGLLHYASLLQDHSVQVALSSSSSSQPVGSDTNLNFTISSAPGVPAGFNRGTLQSNLPSSMWHHHVHRFSPPDGSINNLPVFFGAAAPADGHHHQQPFPSGFDSRLQLCYGDGSSRHSDQKGKADH